MQRKVENSPPQKPALKEEYKSLIQQFQKVTDQKQVFDQFLKRVQFCTIKYDFSDDNKHKKEKQIRLDYLKELTELLLNEPASIQILFIPHFNLCFEMIKKNIFRPLAIKRGIEAIADEPGEECVVFVNAEWVHIEPIFDFLINLICIEQITSRMLKEYVTFSFLHDLLELFHSEEARERQILKCFLSKLHAKVIQRRNMIRQAIYESFFALIDGDYKFVGAVDLLEFQAAIISGFSVPLRDKNVVFFKNIIIPLHKVHTCLLFHEQLIRCEINFLSKDPSLVLPLLEGILRYWPFANSTKEHAFLEEILQVIEVCNDYKLLDPIIPKLFKRITKCIAGSHLQVAEKAMRFFENEFFLNLLRMNKEYAFPLLVPLISNLANNHWHSILKGSFNELKKILREIDEQAYEIALSKNIGFFETFLQDKSDDESVKNEDKWKEFSALAKFKNSSFVEPVIPYLDVNIVGERNGFNNKHDFCH